MAYDAESIKVRDFREACRATPSMYLGDDKENGIFNGFLEILNNSCDEAIMGRGDTITVVVSPNSVSVEDKGAGVPRGPNKDCEEVLIELFTKSHTSGKFDSDNYTKVRGLHGVGSSAVCVCSKQFLVEVKRDGYVWNLDFEEGVPKTQTAIQGKATKETGTKITFIPNKEVFHLEEDSPAFDFNRIKEELELTSYFIPNVHFILVDGITGVKQDFYSKEGIKDFAKKKIRNPIHTNYIYGYKHFEDDVEVEVIAQWTTGKEQFYVFSNGALNAEGGTCISGAKTAFTRTVNSLSKNDFDGDAIRKGLVYIINIKHPNPIYQNQIKNKIQNTELKGYTQTVFTEALKEFSKRNPDDFNRIIEMLQKEQKAEAAAERARQAVLEGSLEVEKNQRRKVFATDKLKDAEFLGQDATLLIVEGNSAASSMAMARDIKHYGILAIRGKILNCLANPDEKVFANEEIKLLLSAMNIVPHRYDPSKLRYGRIAICTDADSDGYHIGLLIMSALQYLAPQFIQEKRLCWLRSPLYIVKSGKTETYFFTDAEYEKEREKIKGEVQRNKGLGALSPEQAKRSMFDKKYQRLDVLEPNEEAIKLLTDLMGEEVEPRRNYVFTNIDFSEIRE